MTDVTIDKRFCGPKSSGNGGYSAGLFARVIDGPAAVKLMKPPPFDTPIHLRQVENGFEAVVGDSVIASIEPANVRVDPPEMPSDADIAAAHDDFLETIGDAHLIPYCFVCGTKRAPGDGLRIFSGAAPDSPVNADLWTPADDLAGDDGLIRPEFLWAALDCPTAYALRVGDRMTLLGRLAVDIYRRPKPGERLIAAAWRTGEEGRKHFSSSVLLDENREFIAAANALWIELNDPALIARIKSENV